MCMCVSLTILFNLYIFIISIYLFFKYEERHTEIAHYNLALSVCSCVCHGFDFSTFQDSQYLHPRIFGCIFHLHGPASWPARCCEDSFPPLWVCKASLQPTLFLWLRTLCRSGQSAVPGIGSLHPAWYPCFLAVSLHFPSENFTTC